MRGEIVFYIPQEESHRLLNELDFLLRNAYGDIKKSRQQIAAQVPGVLDLLVHLAQFMPTAIDLTPYFPAK